MQLWMTAFRPDLNSRGLPHILMPQGLKWIEIRACRFPLHKRTKWGLLIGKFEHIPQTGYRAGFKLRVPLVCMCVCVCTFPDKNKTLVKPKELAVWRDSSYRPTGSIQRHWGFKLRGATTVTLVWAFVSFFLKFPCTNTHTQTHSALSTLPLLVCVCVCVRLHNLRPADSALDALSPWQGLVPIPSALGKKEGGRKNVFRLLPSLISAYFTAYRRLLQEQKLWNGIK